jgi:hypothetical protein
VISRYRDGVGNERWEKLDRLEAEIAHARAALGQGLPQLERAADRLLDATTDAPEGTTRDRGHQLWQQLAARIRELRDSLLRERLSACGRCGHRELLVAERCTLTLARGTAVPCGAAVCTRCGEMQMWCEDVAAIRDRFRVIEVAGERMGPFR